MLYVSFPLIKLLPVTVKKKNVNRCLSQHHNFIQPLSFSYAFYALASDITLLTLNLIWYKPLHTPTFQILSWHFPAVTFIFCGDLSSCDQNSAISGGPKILPLCVCVGVGEYRRVFGIFQTLQGQLPPQACT